MECQNTYLFKAQYADGTLYEQGLDDKSHFVEGKNAFYDVYYKPFKPLEDLVGFHLVPVSGEGSVYSVGLVDGSFVIDGRKFFPYQPTKPWKDGRKPLILSNIRIIYWRLTNANMNLSQRDGSIEQELQGLEVAGYIIGFQANDQDGDNHEFVMRF